MGEQNIEQKKKTKKLHEKLILFVSVRYMLTGRRETHYGLCGL